MTGGLFIGIPAADRGNRLGERESAILTKERETGKAGGCRGNLSSPVVAVKVGHWSVTAGAGAILGDITFLMRENRLDLLMAFVFEVGDEELTIPIILVELYIREFVYFEE